MRWEYFFLNPAAVWVLIPIAAILTHAVCELYRRYCEHQERIAMIENGIHRDYADETESVEVERADAF